MISKELIKELLSFSKPHLTKWGVSGIGLFGSSQRDQISENSDIDILIDFEPEKETYLNFIQTCGYLESIFADSKLDIVSKKGLSPFIGPHILNEVEYV